MNSYKRIMAFMKPYKRQIWLSVLFNILTVLFSLISIAALIPTLKIILNNVKEVELIPYSGMLNIKEYLESKLNFYISDLSVLHGAKGALLRVLLVAALLFLLKNIFRYLTAFYITYLKNVVERDLRNDLHKRILGLPIGYYSDSRKGDIMSRLTTDIVEIQWAVLSSIQRMIQDPLMILLTLIVMIIISPQLTLFVAILLPLTGIVISTIGRKLKKPSEKAKEELGKIMARIEENIHGLQIIKSYTTEKRSHINFEKSNDIYFKNMNKMLYLRELSSPISEVIGSFVIIAIMWYGSVLILEEQSLTQEMFFAYILLFYQIIAPVKSLSNAINDIKRGDASAKRILSLLDTSNPIKDPKDPQQLNDLKNGISLKGVSFAYSDKNVLNNINMEIKKGESIALVGQSGSGKTTIANLLSRFYDIEEGRIEIDGINIKNVTKENLRSHIGYISQDAILFNDSVIGNLKVGNPNANMDQIINATKAANAYEFVMDLKEGFDTSVGENGSKLSGGQRQRLTIARAILKDPDILILDEATSALDAEAEKLVQNALEHVMKNRTSIVIAHRLSTIKKVDKIYVMQDGEVIEEGNHQSLISQNGTYKRLVDLQVL